MPILNRLLRGSHGVGLTTALNYAGSGLIDWPLACVFIGGGLLAQHCGSPMARRLAGKSGALTSPVPALIFFVAVTLLWQSERV